MVEGGADVPDNPWIDADLNEHDSDNKNELPQGDTTQPFQPGGSSTPYHGGEGIGIKTFSHEQSGLRDTSYKETSFGGIPSLDGSIHEDDKPSLVKKAKEYIKGRFPRTDFEKLGPPGFGKKPGNQYKIVSFGSKGGETPIFKRDGRSLLKDFTDKFKKSLGPEAEALIAKDNENIREERQKLKEMEKNLQEMEQVEMRRKKVTEELQTINFKIERTQAKIDQLGSKVENESEVHELEQWLKNYQRTYENLKTELAALDEMKEQGAKLQRQNEEGEAVIENDDVKEAARERVAAQTKELARLQTQIVERENALPLRERVKEIFKKYGVTVTAIVLAAGVTIRAVVGAITNALKTLGNGLVNWLKTIGQKTASLLPGLLGSIVSYLFKTAGQVVGFLAKHTWLIILAVVTFLMEQYIKKRGCRRRQTASALTE